MIVLPKNLQPIEFNAENIFDLISTCLKFGHFIISLHALIIFWIQFWWAKICDKSITAAFVWLRLYKVCAVPWTVLTKKTSNNRYLNP